MKALSTGVLIEASTRCVGLCQVWDEMGGTLCWAEKGITDRLCENEPQRQVKSLSILAHKAISSGVDRLPQWCALDL